MFEDLIRSNRSFRRFDEAFSIDMSTLRDLISLARFSPSGANRQPLKFILSCTKESNNLIFPNLAWAGYLKDWGGPQEGERPTAYIIILGDTEIMKQFGVDHGIAAQSIMLGAVERGLGGCMIGSIKRDQLREVLNIPARYEILLALALGKPAEEVVLETVGADGDIKYWRDENDVHHVPKRSLGELILGEM
jgi:nitroreductase